MTYQTHLNTPLNLVSEETRIVLPRGTVVYGWSDAFGGYCYYSLGKDTAVIIEERDETNYDNQRRAVDPIRRLHMFWVNGNKP